MKVKCIKIVSPITNEDLGNKGIGLCVGNDYTVLVFTMMSNSGSQVVLRNEDNHNVGVYSLDLFDIVDGTLSRYWKMFRDDLGYTLCPEEWTGLDFWEKLEENYREEMEIFEYFVEKIESE
ncbi:hypothetical protein [Motilimonas pumila]|uniref:Uncharacterized protein n=1 Tax=Motilimonas pumila TaxID=2303987 RepID=A0A418Y936_9GAMM|nr:hypothetical protein [Motilimonas pumila]RJG36162.1 hypothetical protein D1Z90_20510 [Motilimonas pumila]